MDEPVVGQWVIRELRRHGYHVSPGTLYPLLARMQDRGWLRSKSDPRGGCAHAPTIDGGRRQAP